MTSARGALLGLPEMVGRGEAAVGDSVPPRGSLRVSAIIELLAVVSPPNGTITMVSTPTEEGLDLTTSKAVSDPPAAMMADARSAVAPIFGGVPTRTVLAYPGLVVATVILVPMGSCLVLALQAWSHDLVGKRSAAGQGRQVELRVGQELQTHPTGIAAFVERGQPPVQGQRPPPGGRPAGRVRHLDMTDP